MVMSSGSDPDPDSIRSLNPDPGSGYRRRKNDSQKYKKIKEVHVLTCWLLLWLGRSFWRSRDR
jgi:hypothetical protein